MLLSDWLLCAKKHDKSSCVAISLRHIRRVFQYDKTCCAQQIYWIKMHGLDGVSCRVRRDLSFVQTWAEKNGVTRVRRQCIHAQLF